jgi:antitoxin Phd
MKLNTNQIVPISEANQNFSRVARMVEKTGEVYIFKNNKPKYKIIDLEHDTAIEMTDDEKIDFVSQRILKQYRRAFEELAR